MFMRNRLARKMAAEMREATCAGTQTSKAPTLSGPSVTNHYSVTWYLISTIVIVFRFTKQIFIEFIHTPKLVSEQLKN